MAKVIERKPLTWAEKTYLPQILGGLKVTLQNMFRRKVTLEYPDERPPIPEGYRGVPTLVKDPNDRVKCVSCQLCEFVCPPKAIRITPGEINDQEDPQRAHVEKEPQEFDINMLRCIYCGLCEEVCPEEAVNRHAGVRARKRELGCLRHDGFPVVRGHRNPGQAVDHG